MVAIRVSAPAGHLDRAAQLPAEVHAGAAGIEIEPVDHLLAEHGRSLEQVVEDGDALPVDVGAGVLRLRAAHDQLATGERDARQAGQVLDHADGILLRPRHVAQLLLHDGAAGGASAVALARHGGGEVADRDAAQVEGDLRLAPGLDVHLRLRRQIFRHAGDQHVIARQQLQAETPLRVGRGSASHSLRDHLDPRQRLPRAAGQHLAGHRSRQRQRRRFGKLRRSEREPVDEVQPRRHGLAVANCRREPQLLQGGGRGLDEGGIYLGVAGHLYDLAVRADAQLTIDVGLAPAEQRLLRIPGRVELDQLGPAFGLGRRGHREGEREEKNGAADPARRQAAAASRGKEGRVNHFDFPAGPGFKGCPQSQAGAVRRRAPVRLPPRQNARSGLDRDCSQLSAIWSARRVPWWGPRQMHPLANCSSAELRRPSSARISVVR